MKTPLAMAVLALALLALVLSAEGGKPKRCFYPCETGPCRAYFIRYYYNWRSGKCEKFVYGGCGGNTNNFKSKWKCRVVCGWRG